jgi:methyltransferase (TIGR00027 family)
MRLNRPISISIFFLLLGSIFQAVEPELPSKTAVWAAAGRAVGAKHPDALQRNPDDLAIRFLGPRERALLQPDYPMEALDLDYDASMAQLGYPLAVAVHTFRTKAFDAALLDALKDDARQVVVLGAGFDSRGYRFQPQLSGVRFIEVDYGPTQEYKKQRVTEVLGVLPQSVLYVPVDFTKDSLLAQLTQAGYSEREKTFFLWEGVTYYLPESAVKDTLQFVRDHSAAGSRIAFDYTLSTNPNLNNPRTLFARWGEPWLFGFPGGGAAAFVRREGLDVMSDTLAIENICIARVPQ